jgi:glycine hydroxymethyltransferase
MQVSCDYCSISLNKNTVLGDKSALTPGGVRIGSPALTTRGLMEADFRKVADFLHEAVQASLEIQKISGPKLVEFEKMVKSSPEIKKIRCAIQAFITTFPMPGFDIADMRYKEIETC